MGAGLLLVIGAALQGCDDGSGSAEPSTEPTPILAPDEVTALIELATRALPVEVAVAVTDRRGVPLGVATNFGLAADPQSCQPYCGSNEPQDCGVLNLALQLARTSAFFANDQSPLTSRTVRFISDVNFPPGVQNAAAGGLFSIENTNRGCKRNGIASGDANDVPGFPPARNIASVVREVRGQAPLRCENADDAAAICGCTRGPATVPGGVPIYKNGRLAGGIGVAVRDVPLTIDPVAVPESSQRNALSPNADGLRLDASDPRFAQGELAARAFAGDNLAIPTIAPKGLAAVCEQTAVPRPACCADDPPCRLSFLPADPPPPFDIAVFLEGIELPFVADDPDVPGPVGSGAGVATFVVAPGSTETIPAPTGWLVGPRDATDSPPGVAPLSAGEVEAIISNGVNGISGVRSAIRLPRQARAKLIFAVTDTNGELLGLFRMTDALVDAIDVCPAKARTSAYLSSNQVDPADRSDVPRIGDNRGEAFPPGTAISARTLGFGAQPFFPSGINGTEPGPFRVTFLRDSNNPCTLGRQPTNGLQNGLIFFPGSVPLYRNGVLVGGIGASGDGVEQDDIGTAEAARGFEAPNEIRADRIFVRDVRLPYLKFNRQPDE